MPRTPLTLPTLALALGAASIAALALAAAPPPARVDATPAARSEPPRGETARALIKGLDGKTRGSAWLEDTAHGVVISATLEGLPAGSHAFHIHETGKCEPPFKSAGGHFNPAGHKHGFRNPDGLHAGDLPNVEIGDSGKVRFQVFAAGVTLKAGDRNSLLDADGAALVVHAKEDDLATDPTGSAGDRIACGVIERSPAR